MCLTVSVTKGDRFVFGSQRDNYNTKNGESIYLDSCCMSFYSFQPASDYQYNGSQVE
jgi:hypothetical protein